MVSIQTLSHLGDTKLFKGKGLSFQASIECIRMQQAYHHSIGKRANKDIVLFPLGGSSLEGKHVDFTSDHGVAHYLFQHLSFFLQPDIYTGIQGHFSHQQGDFDIIIVDGRKFLCIQGPFVGCPHQVDGVGV